MASENDREFPKLRVNADIDDGFRQLHQQTGATVAWLRRDAYQKYLTARAAELAR